MQSGYGVSEIPQFMVDGGVCSTTPLFAAGTTADIHSTTTTPQQKHHHYHHQQQQQQQFPHYYQYQDQPPPLQQPPRFPYFHHPIPITQQLLQQTHQFHLFQQEQQSRISHHQPPPHLASAPAENTDLGGAGGGDGGGEGPLFLRPAMNFQLSVNEHGGGGGRGGSRDGLHLDDDGILQGDEDGSESRLQQWPLPPREQETTAAIKQPFWRPLDLDYNNRNNKRCNEENPLQLETSSNKHFKQSKQVAEAEDGSHKLFSELEAICKPGNGSGTTANQTGSGSALTGENPATVAAACLDPNVDPNAVAAADDGPSTSTGEEETPVEETHKSSSSSSKREMRREKRKRKRKKQQQQMRTIAAFLESVVKQLMDHQEMLHRRFMEVMERRDQERTAKEEARREQEAARSSLEAKARVEQQAVASAREAAIISFLEKFTGETITLPSIPLLEETKPLALEISDDHNNNSGSSHGVLNPNRWPKPEVEALIQVRSGLDFRFQEPGLKGPLWEEVSSRMASMGYRRSAKRCKEKWENINKYFRKAKESQKKRPQNSKTCPYFHRLDQLYSKTPIPPAATAAAIAVSATASTTANAENKEEKEDERHDEEENHQSHEASLYFLPH